MTTSRATHWRVARDRALALDEPLLMGILNATPDSFSDGGRYASADDAVEAALRMVEDGARIIDVGGESTRPGAARVSVDEQVARTAPVVAGIRARSDVAISIDTTRAAVAAAALDAGATIVNDVSAGLEDDALLPLVAQRGCGVVLMHRRLPPEQDRYSHEHAAPPVYDDVVADVRAFLLERCRCAEALGVAADAIAIDPGLGFGKSVEQNFALIAHSADFVATGRPVLGAASRKSFIGHATGEAAPERRVAGSVAVTILQHGDGIRIFRVHDVAEHARALAVTRAVASASNAR